MDEQTEPLAALHRLNLRPSPLRQWAQLPLFLLYFIIPLSVYVGYTLVIWTSEFQLIWLTRLVCIWSACHWLHQGAMGWMAGVGNENYDIRLASYDAELE
ncbi:hypothetical protein LTR62_000347 [Meristemomyces frigidus]|uniref:Uncharacterized protein n=1 Tax=Meristemomyces frigidus TaxID=1508187 RepID=A0AAN7YID1_9PEZI|nr:hypothetical protein LTR62_000347 [Meristemomyces frigidus]